jgi:membrane protease YdiL (CAAX protease family)
VTESNEAQSEFKPSVPIANYWHTLLVVVLIGLNAVRSALRTGDEVANRPRIYLRIILFEWFVFAVVVIGVRLRKAPLQTILGKRWESLLEFLRDIGTGAVLWFVALVTVGILGGAHGGGSSDRGVTFLIPQTSFEMLLWLVVAISAGICEEAVYRGYLQRQASALTRSSIAGVLVSSAMFGAAHIYQGGRRAIVIAASAILYGIVVEWRGTVRPGMFAHALQDGIAPILIRLMRR